MFPGLEVILPIRLPRLPTAAPATLPVAFVTLDATDPTSPTPDEIALDAVFNADVMIPEFLTDSVALYTYPITPDAKDVAVDAADPAIPVRLDIAPPITFPA